MSLMYFFILVAVKKSWGTRIVNLDVFASSKNTTSRYKTPRQVLELKYFLTSFLGPAWESPQNTFNSNSCLLSVKHFYIGVPQYLMLIVTLLRMIKKKTCMLSCQWNQSISTGLIALWRYTVKAAWMLHKFLW